MNDQTRTCTYKGKAYRLLYIGQTKFGRKAKLSFMDGSKEFWVDASQVTEGGSIRTASRPSSSRNPRTGCSCGSRDGMIQETDCFQCVHDA